MGGLGGRSGKGFVKSEVGLAIAAALDGGEVSLRTAVGGPRELAAVGIGNCVARISALRAYDQVVVCL